MSVENEITVPEVTLLEDMAEYIVALRAEPVRPEVRELAKTFFADAFSVMIAGHNEEPTKIAMEYVRSVGCKPTATVWGEKSERADAYHAALVNGIASHFHDYDDVCTTMIGHPSVAILPCVLALGEELGSSGEEVLRAYIIGMEVCALMGRAFSPEHNRRGWHSTQSLGVFGSAAAAGCLLGLDAEQLRNALGIAASESCGLKGNTGTMTKPLHAGRAAAKGIMAAKLAKLGFTSNRNIMEMESGFIRVTTGVYHRELVYKAMAEHNSEFINVGFLMKPWPACRATHNGIWAMIELLDEYDIRPEEIEHISCRVLPYAKDILRYTVAKTPTEGKFSMNYVIALIALNRHLYMKDFEGASVDDPKVIDMMERVEMVVDESIMPGQYYNYLESTIVEVTMKDGRMLSRRCDYAKGTSANPMTKEERYTKWRDCMGRALKSGHIDGILDAVSDIDKLPDLKVLSKLVSDAV